MIKRAEFYQLLISHAGTVPVYEGYVPADAVMPAISYSHLQEIPGERDLDGHADLRSDSWQIEVVAQTRDEADAIINQFALLDNTSNADFQWITVLNQHDDPADPAIAWRRGFVDIKTTNRSNV